MRCPRGLCTLSGLVPDAVPFLAMCRLCWKLEMWAIYYGCQAASPLAHVMDGRPCSIVKPTDLPSFWLAVPCPLDCVFMSASHWLLLRTAFLLSGHALTLTPLDPNAVYITGLHCMAQLKADRKVHADRFCFSLGFKQTGCWASYFAGGWTCGQAERLGKLFLSAI